MRPGDFVVQEDSGRVGVVEQVFADEGVVSVRWNGTGVVEEVLLDTLGTSF